MGGGVVKGGGVWMEMSACTQRADLGVDTACMFYTNGREGQTRSNGGMVQHERHGVT